MKRQAWAAVAVLAVVGWLLVTPFSAASAQTSSSVCGGTNQPCANTPLGQVQAAPSEGAAPSPLAQTGVNTEWVLLASVATLAFGVLVLLFVEARESRHVLRYEEAVRRSLS